MSKSKYNIAMNLYGTSKSKDIISSISISTNKTKKPNLNIHETNNINPSNLGEITRGSSSINNDANTFRQNRISLGAKYKTSKNSRNIF